MKSWKQPTLLSRNGNELNACIMILENNKQEDEEFLYYFYKTNEASSQFQNLKGVLLASSGISNSIFFDDYRVISFSMDDNQYKSTSKTYLNTYLVTVVVPSITPDNILLFICNEFIQFCNLFFENFEDCKKFTNILNKYSEILFYLTLNYTLSPSKEDIIGTPISLLPIMNMTFSFNEQTPIFLIKPGLSDSLRTDLIEHLNSLNTDRSVLQETMTLMEPPFYLKGYILLYRGFVVFNTLNNKEMANGARLAMLHEMYMRSQSSPEVLSCEFLFDMPVDCPSNQRKKTLTTLLAQREFVLLISLEILGKNNCSFDPFYHKRAEDLLVNLLKKSFSSIINNELFNNSIKMSNNGFSLSSAMEGLDLLASRLEKSDRANQKNIFKEKNRTNNSMNTKELKEMNKFAVTLMSDNFGSELRGNKTRLNLGKTAFKPAMKEIAKEIGSIKQLPRVRGTKMMNTMTLLNRKKN